MKSGLPAPTPIQTRRIVFRNRDIPLVGTLWIPAGIASGRGHPAIVVVTPGSSVKEQVGSVYASRLAAEGYVALAFDPSYQGESSGKPRDLEDPAARVEDIRCALDFLMTLPFVNEARIGALGICAGGGYAVNAALTERRIRAIGLVVPVNIGRAFRQMQAEQDALDQTLDAVATQRGLEARGGAERRVPWIPDTIEEAGIAGVTDRDTIEAITYYRTPRGYSANSTNRLLFRSHAALLSFDAFHLVEELLAQPVQVVVAARRGNTFSFEDGEELFRRARNAKDFEIIEGAGHYTLYDDPNCVGQTVARLASFYGEWLGA